MPGEERGWSEESKRKRAGTQKSVVRRARGCRPKGRKERGRGLREAGRGLQEATTWVQGGTGEA